MTVTTNRSAVVLGASVAGLCAAGVLSERFDDVVVVDRDELPEAPAWRHQVPQGRHPHLLLPAGARLFEGWFPGFVDELLAAGAVEIDLCRDFYWYQAGGVWRRPTSDLRSPAMSRPLLEHVLRRRVGSIPNVTIRHGTTADGLELDPSGERVVGLRLAGDEVVAADLVVDASGRQARSVEWLGAMGYEPPACSTVAVDTRYVTRLYRRAPSANGDWKAAAVVSPPDEKRLVMVMPLEDDRWYVTFCGLNGEVAPTDDDGLLAYARSLPTPIVADLMASSEPLGPPVTHRFPANQRRHVERMRRFPLGWVLLGDAVSSFDPVYGQGITSAAMQAHALAGALDAAPGIGRRFARRYFRAAGRTVAVPWSIAVGGDFAYDGTTGPKPFATDLLNRYLDRMAVAAQHDDHVLLRLNEVISMTRRPQALLHPRLVARTLRAPRVRATKADVMAPR